MFLPISNFETTMLSPQTILSFFAILTISSLTIFIARKVKLPHTVFLVIVGAVLGVLSFLPPFDFIRHFELTPSLLFYLLLPTLIFESAYAISTRKMAENSVIILLLSIVSLLISAAAIAFVLGIVFSLLGMEISFMFLLLFGALISATDPVAVLALFKEYGAPERLSLIFEGESLFNDATAVAFFLIVLGILVDGFSGSTTVLIGIGQFLFMMIGGVLFGLVMGLMFAGLVGATRESEVASITLTIALAHLTFILSEVISKHIHFFDHEFPLSSIIATTVASLIMGNYGRAKLHPSAEPFVARLWSQLAFMANSVIFVLIGLLVVRSQIWSAELVVPILITVAVVALCRALSIYPVTYIYNLFTQKENIIPTSWSHLLSWGSLRGALAVTMVFLVPSDLELPYWTLEITPQEFLLALTVGCICATLFIKAPTIQTFMVKLGLYKRNQLEEFEYHEAHAFIHDEVKNRIKQFHERGYISDQSLASIQNIHDIAEKFAHSSISQLSSEDEAQSVDRVLRIFAIGIEIKHLKELYRFDEINEFVFRKIYTKLALQLEALEHNNLAAEERIQTDGMDVFERLYFKAKRFFVTQNKTVEIENAYLYYRAQAIIARKVLKELEHIIGIESAVKIFSKEPLTRVMSLYETYKTNSHTKALYVASHNPNIIDPLNHRLALKGAYKVATTTLSDLEEKRLVTKNLSITLADELELMHELK